MPPKRKADDSHASDFAAKRFKANVTDSDASQLHMSSLNALSKDSLLHIATYLDTFTIVSLFSISKRFTTQLSDQTWREMCVQRLGAMTSSAKTKTMNWRALFVQLNRTKRPFEYVEQLLGYLKRCELSDLQRLQILSNTIANQEFQQTLVDQVQEFLEAHPLLRPLWDIRVVYLYYEVFAGAEWSMENYKWDVTSTAPVKLLIIGNNGKLLQLTSLSSYFACAWAYDLVRYFKPEIKSIEDVFGTQPQSMGGYCSDDEERVANEEDDFDEAEDRDQNKWFREQPISQILLPFTPQEDETDKELMTRLEKKGWHDIDDYPAEDFTTLLQQIGLSDVPAAEFKSLYSSAAFPNRERVRYYTHLRGYYATRVPQSVRCELAGVGGLSNWGKLMGD